CMQSLEFPFTF
nr:immunoglobulin light chain junction region [Macaca mulatta]MOV82167.1 immunoglobulin light chain junction region [Macaca mulatta]MOV86489.1 immunoglobulin light chain junction region [Macaca mulatta]MOW61733.1 immunoglobulin light chain junction region [Macaca mulatta]MOW62410.1 immunoglobulin light chain junction region [Macaca mulatta]